MADSSLDDFFAKKDKSKKKSKSKMTPADVLSGGDEGKKAKKKKAQEKSGGPGLSTTETTSRKAEVRCWGQRCLVSSYSFVQSPLLNSVFESKKSCH